MAGVSRNPLCSPEVFISSKCQEKNTLLGRQGKIPPMRLQKDVPNPCSQPRQPSRYGLGRVCCDLLPFCRFHSPRGGDEISACAVGGSPGAAVIYSRGGTGLVFLTASPVMDEAKACSGAACAYAAIAS